MSYCGVCAVCRPVVDTLRRVTAQQMTARHEQIGQRAGHEQAMGILLQPAIAHLGKTKHALDDPDWMLDFGAHLRFGPVSRPLDLIDNTAVAVAAVGEIASLGGMLTDHRALAAVSAERDRSAAIAAALP